jgi:hypothetical protein
MTEFVRVKDNDTGHEFSIPKRLAEGLKGDSISILEKKEALDANGRPAPAKPNTRVLESKTEQAPATSAEMTPPTATKAKAGESK